MFSISSLADLLGMKPRQIQHWLSVAPNRVPWRVRSIDRGVCHLLTASAVTDGLAGEPEPRSEPSPESVPALASCDAIPDPETPLAVGDWVLLEERADAPPRVDVLLERTSLLRRGATQGRSAEQLIASNLDTVFVVMAFSSDEKQTERALGPRRVERYVAAITEAGATPVVVLNKADLAVDRARAAELSERVALPVLALSAGTGEGLDALATYLAKGETVAFVGSSGVGKSTLVNRLCGAEVLVTAEVRERDAKGRHTTTRRELVCMPSGALLIDTPGMRELALVSPRGVIGFRDVEALAEECQFRDCRHEHEPGCAVRAAALRGELNPGRLDSFHSLERESLRQEARHDAYARHLLTKQYKRFGRLSRTLQKWKNET